jgi:hypothetical protein
LVHRASDIFGDLVSFDGGIGAAWGAVVVISIAIDGAVTADGSHGADRVGRVRGVEGVVV